jgi:D-tyrosyl-tRNA(Tyr) deacylase
MRALIQRVRYAAVEIDGQEWSRIGAGLLVLVGIEHDDSQEDSEWLSGKIAAMRLFADEQGKMNRSVIDIEGELLVVSQFTLHASTKKGNRPSFLRAAAPAQAEPMYEQFCRHLQQLTGRTVKQGRFGADMQISLCNDGPVTIGIDSKDRQ